MTATKLYIVVDTTIRFYFMARILGLEMRYIKQKWCIVIML